MQIILRTKDLDPTPSLHEFVEKKFGSLTRFLKPFEPEGVTEITVTVSRTTKHHEKGDVFRAIADLRLPKKILRATETNEDPRVAIDLVKRKIQIEIQKYKTQHTEPNRNKRK